MWRNFPANKFEAEKYENFCQTCAEFFRIARISLDPMPQLDRLFESIVQRGATQAILLSDQPTQLFIGQQIIEGSPLSGGNLQNMLAEVVPPERSHELLQDGQFEIYHATPQGNMRLHITRRGKTLKAVIAPAPQILVQPTGQQPLQSTAPATFQPPVQPTMPYNGAPPAPPPPTMPYNGPSSQPTMPYNGSPPMPPNPYGVPGYPMGTGQPNSSGMGAAAQVPPEIMGGWNWGAFFCNWIWGIGNSTWIALLCFVPCVGWVMPFVLGAKGNEWAWRNRRFNSVEEFKKTQAIWGWVGLGLSGIGLVAVLPLMLMSAILAPVGARAHSNALRTRSQSNIKEICLGAVEFSQDHNDTLPTGKTIAEWKSATISYTKSDDIYASPSTLEPYSVNPALSGASLEKINAPATTPMFYESKADALEGHNVGFADGHVKWIRNADWPTYRTYLDSVGGQ